MSQAFCKTLSGKEATPMPFAPVVMLPQVLLSGVQPQHPPNPCRGCHWLHAPAMALRCRLSSSVHRAPWMRGTPFRLRSRSTVSLSACVVVTHGLFPLKNCRSASSQISRQSQKHSRCSLKSQRCLQTSAGGMAARRKQLLARASSMAFSRFRNGLAAEVRNRMAAWEAPWQLWSEHQKWNGTHPCH